MRFFAALIFILGSAMLLSATATQEVEVCTYDKLEFDGKFDGIKLKGEYVIIIEAKSKEEIASEAEEVDPVALAKKYVSEGLGINEAAKKAAKETNSKKSDIYKQIV